MENQNTASVHKLIRDRIVGACLALMAISSPVLTAQLTLSLDGGGGATPNQSGPAGKTRAGTISINLGDASTSITRLEGPGTTLGAPSASGALVGLSGILRINFIALGTTAQNFNPTNFTGGTTYGTDGITSISTGTGTWACASDLNENVNNFPGQGIVFTIDLSSVTGDTSNLAVTAVRLYNDNASDGARISYLANGAGASSVVYGGGGPIGSDVTYAVSQSLADGDALAFWTAPSSGQRRLYGLTFNSNPPEPLAPGFDNGSGDNLWATPGNWNPDGLPSAPSNAIIDGYDVILNSAVAIGPAELQLLGGSLTISGSLSAESMVMGRVLESEARLVMEGSSASLGHTGASTSDEFAVGSAGTVETRPNSGGSGPLELGTAKLTLDLGSQWILDGSNFPGPYNLGEQFVLANYGSFSGSITGIRTRNFDLPPNRKLQLVSGPTSLYYEVVAQTAASGPNVIIVNVDDMAGGQHFNFEGRDCLTPTLDTLVSTGLRFTSAFAASTVCGPSRYALLTSRWPSRNTSAQFNARYPLGTLGRFGVSDTELEPDGQNLGAWLQNAGYRTGLVGKGHLTDDDLNQTNNWAAKGLMTYPSSADPASDATTNAKMQHNHRVLCQRMRAFGFDYVASYYKANLAELRNDALNVHNQEWITRGALDFIEENHNERFFLYMAPTINHGPVRNDLTKTLLANKGYTSAGYLPDEDYSFMPSRQAIINEVTTAGKDLISARETWLDYSIKAIINKLTEHGIRNDTLIIFTSDHGEKTLYGPLVWGKSSLFDLGMKVPLVMNWPNGITSPGRVYDEIVSHVDIAPTLLSLAGSSSLPTRPVDGVSLMPVFASSSAAVRDDLFCEIGYARAVRTKDRKYVAVRYDQGIYDQIASGYLWERVEGNNATGEFTEPRPYYVNNRQLGSLAANSHETYFDDDQLYNLTTDPNELTNLYGQEPATAYDLKKRLADYIGGIPGRPFRQFNDSSTEFSPAPAGAPAPPGTLQSQFLGLQNLKLAWTDTSNNELGFIVEQSENGAPFEVVAESASGSVSATVPVNPSVEDLVLRVSSYNASGDSAAAVIDLLSPENWRYREFGDIDPELDDPISQWTTDADGDGQATIWEYAFGTKPRDASSVRRAEGRITAETGNSFLEYWVPRDARRAVQISGAVAGNLFSWSTGEPECLLIENEDTHLLFRSATPIEDEPRQFIRAEILEP